MFNVGDRVVCKSDFGYRELFGKRGTVREVDENSILVEFDDHINGHDGDGNCQDGHGWWCCEDEIALEMDAYKYAIAHTRYSIEEIDDIVKGDNNMNNILEIYESRKANKLFEETKSQIEKVKMADPSYKAWKTALDTINKIYAKDFDVYGEICPREPKLSEKSEEKLKELNSSYSNQRRAIEQEIEEIKAQLSICETYEQKQNVLKLYGVINADGKING